MTRFQVPSTATILPHPNSRGPRPPRCAQTIRMECRENEANWQSNFNGPLDNPCMFPFCSHCQTEASQDGGAARRADGLMGDRNGLHFRQPGIRKKAARSGVSRKEQAEAHAEAA